MKCLPPLLIPRPTIFTPVITGGLIAIAGMLHPAVGADVWMTASDTSNGTITSFNGDLDRWSNSQAPAPGSHYTNASFLLRSPSSGGPHDFRGDSLTLTRSDSAIGRLLLKGPDNDSVTIGNLILNGGLLDLGVSNGTNVTRLAGSITVQAGFNNYIIAEGSTTPGTGGEVLDIQATIHGTGTLQIGGLGGAAVIEGLHIPTAAVSNSAGTVKLSAANPYSGKVTVAGNPVNSTRGGLQQAHLHALQHATLHLNTQNSNQTPPLSFLAAANDGPFLVGALEGTSTLTLHDTDSQPVTLDVGGNGSDGEFSGALTGPGDLVKSGSGTLTLSGPSLHTGNTIVSAGTLSLSSATLSDESAVSISSNATLHLAHQDSDTVAELLLAGVSQPDGTYDASNTAGRIAGGGRIHVGAPHLVESPYPSRSPWTAHDGSARNEVAAGNYLTIPFMPVSETPSADALRIAGTGETATIYYSIQDAAVVGIASNALSQDIENVTGLTPDVSTETPTATASILVGTLGMSPLIDGLVESGKIEVSAIAGKWEAYTASVVENPLPGVDRALVIAGSDRRGTAFGIFALSEAMGVSPWHFWADVPTPRKPALFVGGSHTQPSPGVKYRGIFLNDEDWGLQPWAAETFEPEVGNIGPKTYATIYELLLRLHANVIWPAMHEFPVETTPFYMVPGNKEAADDHAIVISTSHHEPMMRNSHEYDTNALGPYNYWTNRTNIYDFWEHRVIETADCENIYTIGMRGRADSGMAAPSGTTNEQKAEKIESEIIPDQRQMIAEHVHPDPSEIPQIFIPYKETLVQYQSGLDLPDDVTIVWPDDNHGYIRQLPNAEERSRSGGSGVYYHLSYWGVPSSYLWFCTTPPGMTCSELLKAWDFRADKMWLVNVGDLKPMEIGTEFFLRLARDPEAFRDFDQHEYFSQWADHTFGQDHASAIASVLQQYFQLNIVKRPEHLGRDNTGFSHFEDGDEAASRLDAFDALLADAESIHTQLAPELQSAFYEMVLYQIRASRLINRRNLLAERSRLWEDQERASTNALAEEAQAAHDQLFDELKFYNEVNADGKWNGMLNPDPQASGWWRETQNPFLMPNVGSHHATGSPELGVVIEGSKHPLEPNAPGELPIYNRHADTSHFIDVFNQGGSTLEWTASASDPWIELSKSSGSGDARIIVSIDWEEAPRGHAVPGHVIIAGASSESKINLRTFHPHDLDISTLPSAVEDRGKVIIEAEHYSSRNDSADGRGWRLQDQAAASDDGMTIQPVTASSLDPTNLPADAPSLTYEFHAFSTGTIRIHTQCLPTHRLTSDHPGVRYAISLNGDTPKVVDVYAREYSSGWYINTLRAASIGTSRHEITEPGPQTIKIMMVDAGVVLDKITVEIASGSYEAEDLVVLDSSKPAVEFTDGPATEGKGLHIQSTQQGDFATLTIPDTEPGDYQLSLRVKKWVSRGIMQISVAEAPDGPYTDVGGPHDLYNPSELYADIGPLPLTFTNRGPKYLRFTVVGKNASASNYWILLDTITMKPVVSLSGQPISDWRYAFFGTPHPIGHAADHSDPDKDRIPNLIEYATGSYPTLAGRPATSPAIIDDHLAIHFKRARVASDVIYEVLAGNALPPRDLIWSSEDVPYPVDAGPSIMVTVTDTQDIGASPTRFLRLAVTRR